MHEVSGSLYLTQEARTVIVIQPVVNDMTDPRILFDIGKANDEEITESMSCWERANGEFLPLELSEEEWDEIMNPKADAGRGGTIMAEVMSQLFDGGKRTMTRKQAVHALKDLKFSQPNAYNACKIGCKFPAQLTEQNGFLVWRDC